MNVGARSTATKRIDTLALANDLGGRLRDYRDAASISVRELARRIEVSPSLISQVEHGKVTPSVETLYRIANELGLSVGDFFGDRKEAVAANGRRGKESETGEFVQRKETRKKVQLAGGVTWERLAPRRRRPGGVSARDLRGGKRVLPQGFHAAPWRQGVRLHAHRAPGRQDRLR